MQFDTSAALDNLATLAPETKPRRESRGFWATAAAGVGAAGAELLADVSSLSVQDDGRRGMLSDERAAARIKRESLAKSARDYAHELRPDPATAGTAENIVFGLSRGLSKAAVLVGSAGPLAGGAAFGASEGAATFEDLTRQGVDSDTAMKAAAASGVASAVGVALPLVGSTTGRTIALSLAGGPGGFMAQQAATREILKRADYGEVAKQFDPFDPTGLLLATLLPAPFAAIGIRRNIKAARAAPEHVDAAMVHNLTTLADQHAVQQAEGVPAVPPFVEPPKAPKVAAVQPADAAAPAAGTKETGPALTEDQLRDVPKPAPAGTDPLLSATAARVAEIERDAPAMPVRTLDDGKVVTVADELAEARRMASEGGANELGTLDADLVRVAAECSLSFGA